MLLLIISSASAATQTNQIDNALANGTGILSVNFSNANGVTTNSSYVFLNGTALSDFSNINATIDNATNVPFWNQTVNGTIKINNGWAQFYFNKATNGSKFNIKIWDTALYQSDGISTFASFNDFNGTTLEQGGSKWYQNRGTGASIVNGQLKADATSAAITLVQNNSIPYPAFILINKSTVATSSGEAFGMQDVATFAGDIFDAPNSIVEYSDTTAGYITSRKATTYSQTTLFKPTLNTWYQTELDWSGSSLYLFMNQSYVASQATNIPVVNLMPVISLRAGGLAYYDFVAAGKAPDTQWAAWGSMYNTQINITSWGNTYTGNQNLSLTVPYNSNISFNVTTSGIADSIAWGVNGFAFTNKLIPFNITYINTADNDLSTYYDSGGNLYWAYVDFNTTLLSSINVSMNPFGFGGQLLIQVYNYTSGAYETANSRQCIGQFCSQAWTNTTVSNNVYLKNNVLKVRVGGDNKGGAVYEVWAYGATNPNTFTTLFQTVGINTVNATVFNSASNTYDYKNWTVNVTNIPFALTSPANGSTVSSPVTLLSQEWPQNAPYTYYVCLDPACNSVVFTGTMNTVNITTESTSVNLNMGVQYFWYVKNSLGISTSVQNFTINIPVSDGQTGIHGQVYELINGNFVPISGASVYITNNTWSNTITTGTDGYFLFKPLANGSTYTIQAKAFNYLDGNIEIVTTVNGTWYLKNLQLQKCASGLNCFYNQQYVQFVLQDIWGSTFYKNVIVNVYKYGSITSILNGVTGTDGKITFLLEKSQKYTITFISAPQGININFDVTPSDTIYYIIVSASPPSNSNCGNVSTNLTNIPFNATYNTLGFNYNDLTSSTTLINFFVNDANGNSLYTTSAINTNIWSPSFNVNSSVGNTYFWGYNATTTACTNPLSQTVVYTFRGTGRFIDLHIADVWYQWISIMLLTFTTALFHVTKIKFGAVIVPLSAGMYSVFGWFIVNPTILACAIVIGVLVYLRMSEVKTVY